jgi:hypothetical protein
MSNIAQQAIDQSIAETSIIHLPYDADAAETLLAECEDWTEGNTETEYWGADSDTGAEWRVHMAAEA